MTRSNGSLAMTATSKVVMAEVVEAHQWYINDGHFKY
jgi:hypothetical protein